jgi:2-dehydro-3-deoxygluconokinase
MLGPGDVDWDELFGRLGVRCLHTGGIFAALSPTTAALAEEAMRAARAHGTRVSYDLNYRPSLWQALGGKAAAQEVNRRLAPLVDVMLGNEEDFTACLGFEVPGVDPDYGALATAAFQAMIGDVTATYETISVVATTLRTVRSATVNDWGAIAWSADDGFVEATERPGLEILDRVGGGDSFASGLLYGLLELGDLQSAVEYGAAHGALAMTTPGDTSTARLEDVRRVVERSTARIER